MSRRYTYECPHCDDEHTLDVALIGNDAYLEGGLTAGDALPCGWIVTADCAESINDDMIERIVDSIENEMGEL